MGIDERLKATNVATGCARVDAEIGALQAERAKIEAMSAAIQAHQAAIGASQQATDEQTAALDALAAWMSEFIPIAKIVLAQKP